MIRATKMNATMSERQQRPYDSIARSWLALVERRQQSIIELWKSERWRHYYTHAQFLDEMGKVLHLRNQWARLAGVPVSDQIGLPQIGLQQKDLQQIKSQQSLKQNDRHSQNASAREVKSASHGALGQRRLPPSAILAAVAGRL
jgi:hypothetical protein